ncbi:glycosyltransferase [Kocuria sp. cx-455]|uniref:glycosyltransferase n=1 Tax=Kocuria sp. cx-455 TaxID=2771377 RepID=UPI003D736610
MHESSGPPVVDVVIPVHSPDRPLGRAVDSAIAATRGMRPADCGILVVAHHLSARQVESMLSDEQLARVTIIECSDPGTTPAGPRNTALERTTAAFISFLDSDDTLDPGAVDRWLSIAQTRGSDWVLPFQHHSDGRADMTPITRPWRSSNLSAVADRLFYRSSAFGLIRVATARAAGARFDTGVITAEEQAFILRLHTHARRIDYARGIPGLLVHADATDRVSRVPIPVLDQARPALRLSEAQWFAQAPPALQAGFYLKFIRVNIFPSIELHVKNGSWDRSQAQSTYDSIQSLLRAAPLSKNQLSRADSHVIELLSNPETEPARLAQALAARRRFASPAALATPRLSWLLARNAPLRISAAGAIQILRHKWGRRRGSAAG